MPRSLWTGSLSFGLVNVPVALFSAVRDVDLHFHQLHEKDAARIDVRRFCSKEEREVPYEEIGHGYERDDGDLVVLTDEELSSVAPRRTRTIDIEAFVDLADVDPLYFDHPYFLAPTGETEGTLRAYQLLVAVMEETGKAALGRFVLRQKEYLVLIRVRDERLALTTMRFADELRPTDGIETGGRKPAKARREQAVALVEAMAADWDPGAWKDRYRARLEKVIERKKRGKRISAPRAEAEPKPVPDLMAALERSLEAARKRGAGGGNGGARSRDGDGDSAAREELSKDELYERAQAAGVPGRSSMTKDELIDALQG
ncbi:MAG TPA: Ku protein [Solirubrobacteraceae bacterium]|nr:Ku protein [Solirubrobacteraceae bacterium]